MISITGLLNYMKRHLKNKSKSLKPIFLKKLLDQKKNKRKNYFTKLWNINIMNKIKLSTINNNEQ